MVGTKPTRSHSTNPISNKKTKNRRGYHGLLVILCLSALTLVLYNHSKMVGNMLSSRQLKDFEAYGLVAATLLGNATSAAVTPTTSFQVSQARTSLQRRQFQQLLESWNQLVSAPLDSPQKPHFHKVYRAISRQKQVQKTDITVAVHLSVARLNRLVFLIQRWGGPVSVALYIQSRHDLDTLQAFWEEQIDDTLDWTDIHIYMERPDSAAAALGYPHNILRNMAMQGITDSDFVLLLDVDFVTNPPNTHALLKRQMKSDPDLVHQLKFNQTMMVLPAFSRQGVFVKDDTILKIGEYLLPNTKQEALEMLQVKHLTPFHIDISTAQTPTRFPHWIRSDSKSTYYPIQYAYRFEPYVLSYKGNALSTQMISLPDYWPGFRGFGCDKLTFFLEAHHRGYNYAVLRNFFVIHFEHEMSNRAFSMETIHQMLLFRDYMQQTYNLTKKQMEEFKPPSGPLAKYQEYLKLQQHSLLN